MAESSWISQARRRSGKSRCAGWDPGAGASHCHSCQQGSVVSGLAVGQPGWLLPGGGRHRGVGANLACPEPVAGASAFPASWESARAAPPRHARFAPVRRGVGHLQAGAIQADQPPVRYHAPCWQEWQSASAPRTAGAAGLPRAGGAPAKSHSCPPPGPPRRPTTSAALPADSAAPRACSTHVERQGNGVVEPQLWIRGEGIPNGSRI